MKDKILVVEKNRNGEIVKYYITKKEAQKHMSERHKRLDGGRKKKTRALKKNRTRKFH